MEQLLTLVKNNITLTVMLLFIGAGILFLLCHDWNTIRRKAKRAKSISCEDFLENWDTYRQNDKPGCYIILIYNCRVIVLKYYKNLFSRRYILKYI